VLAPRVLIDTRAGGEFIDSGLNSEFLLREVGAKTRRYRGRDGGVQRASTQ
jgi:hypothetical protein